jgi:hypothetical protein
VRQQKVANGLAVTLQLVFQVINALRNPLSRRTNSLRGCRPSRLARSALRSSSAW